MGLANIIINDQGQRALSISWTFTGGAYCHGCKLACIRPNSNVLYIVPEEGEEHVYRHHLHVSIWHPKQELFFLLCYILNPNMLNEEYCVFLTLYQKQGSLFLHIPSARVDR